VAYGTEVVITDTGDMILDEFVHASSSLGAVILDSFGLNLPLLLNPSLEKGLVLGP